MDDAWCFMLVESPFNGVVMKTDPKDDLVTKVVCDWIEAGGPEALRRAKPNVAKDDHWISIPRNILKKVLQNVDFIAAVQKMRSKLPVNMHSPLETHSVKKIFYFICVRAPTRVRACETRVCMCVCVSLGT